MPGYDRLAATPVVHVLQPVLTLSATFRRSEPWDTDENGHSAVEASGGIAVRLGRLIMRLFAQHI